MWKLKQFMPKENAGLEGRIVDFGNFKVQVRNAIAEGGFSCVYLARDVVNLSKQYALKHMICQDEESFDLAMREISVMKTLKGHPNVVTLIAHTVLDMGRTKEALLLLEFCEKSLVSVLESRGAGYFEEKQILLIFRDICNAVFAMHNQSPPIAHRDLKAENVLLGADGSWKLCDFGSISTNHKCFNRPEEMGIEEDNIRKHTTPAYRAPEIWDLYRKEVISEKVDIWALGCLLYRICYLKSAFDGESKLQILNGNYRIPELPKYNGSIIKLIKDMLQASPDARPDITQVWFQVNELLPVELQKDLPNSCATGSPFSTQPMIPDTQDEGGLKRTNMVSRRSPPSAPSSRERPEMQHPKPAQNSLRSNSTGGSLGAFWSTQHAQDSQLVDKHSVFNEEPINQVKPKHTTLTSSRDQRARSPPRSSSKGLEPSSNEDFEIRFSPNGSEYTEKTKISNIQSKSNFQNDTFNAFVAEFDTSKFSSANAASNIKNKTRSADEELATEVDRLKQELKQVNLEKDEMTSKYEKLSAICRSQRQEIQELKHALAATSASSVSKDNLKTQASPGVSQSNTPPREKIEGSLPELKQGLFSNTPLPQSAESKPWSAFDGETKVQNVAKGGHHPNSVRTVRVNSNGRNGNKDASASSNREPWGFGQDNFRAAPSSISEKSQARVAGGTTTSQRPGVPSETKKLDANQPAGWADF